MAKKMFLRLFCAENKCRKLIIQILLLLFFMTTCLHMFQTSVKAEGEKFENELLSRFVTHISSTCENRFHNITKAVSAFNNVEILPGQNLSFNGTTGFRCADTGYRKAKIIVNGKYVVGNGGGVCQVSTTLYNAILLAGLDVVEVNAHSILPTYVKQSFDAMVSNRTSDLKFVNNTPNKMTIKGCVKDKDIIFEVYGKKPDYTIRLRSEVVRDIIPPMPIDYYDYDGLFSKVVTFKKDRYALVNSRVGCESKGYVDKIFQDGRVESKLIRHNIYPAVQGINVFGTQ